MPTSTQRDWRSPPDFAEPVRPPKGIVDLKTPTTTGEIVPYRPPAPTPEPPGAGIPDYGRQQPGKYVPTAEDLAEAIDVPVQGGRMPKASPAAKPPVTAPKMPSPQMPRMPKTRSFAGRPGDEQPDGVPYPHFNQPYDPDRPFSGSFEPLNDSNIPKWANDLADRIPGFPERHNAPPKNNRLKKPPDTQFNVPDAVKDSYARWRISSYLQQQGTVTSLSGVKQPYFYKTPTSSTFIDGRIMGFGKSRSNNRTQVYVEYKDLSGVTRRQNLWDFTALNDVGANWEGTDTVSVTGFYPESRPIPLGQPLDQPFPLPDNVLFRLPNPQLSDFPFPSTTPTPQPTRQPNPSPFPNPFPDPFANPFPSPSPFPNPSQDANPTPSPAPNRNPHPFPSPDLAPSPIPSPANPFPRPDSPYLSPSPTGSPVPTPSPLPSPLPSPFPSPSPFPNNPPLPPCPPQCQPTVNCKFEPYKPEYITIQVPVFGGCVPLVGTAIRRLVNVKCLKGTEEAAMLQFERIFALESATCETFDFSSLKNDLEPKFQEILDEVSEGGNETNFIDIDVPIVIANQDGTATEQTITVKVHEQEATQIQALFQQLADVKKFANSTDRFSERSHNILGGNKWFGEQAANRTPSRLINIHQRLRERGRTDKNLESSESTGEIFDDIYTTTEALIGYTFAKLGLEDFPVEVPSSLLGYTDKEKPIKIGDLSSFIEWFISQFDALVGKFPIEIEIEDSDPAQPGNQFKRIELPNISEALAETYALAVSSSTNADLSINFLMRLAAEVIATKNAALVTQDYARGNAAFLGYKGNPAKREVDYAFNPQSMEHLDQLLSESKGYIQGWQEDDPETVVGFLQKIVFASGIIKAVFFRNQKQMKQLQRELESLTSQDREADEKDWKKFVDLINQFDSAFNKGDPNYPVTDASKPKIDSLINEVPKPKEKGTTDPNTPQQP